MTRERKMKGKKRKSANQEQRSSNTHLIERHFFHLGLVLEVCEGMVCQPPVRCVEHMSKSQLTASIHQQAQVGVEQLLQQLLNNKQQ